MYRQILHELCHRVTRALQNDENLKIFLLRECVRMVKQSGQCNSFVTREIFKKDQ